LAAKYLAKKNVKHIGIIGTGAQSEFQVLAQSALFDIETVKYFDIDPEAMTKFHDTLKDQSFKLIACKNAKEVVEGVDIITTATASKGAAKILSFDALNAGLHINGIGGDCPGKTELDATILSHAKIAVEFLPQSKVEGEIQHLESGSKVHAELWEMVTGKKKGRESDSEITLFDSVGFAIEDFAILKLVRELAIKHHVGTDMDLIPALTDPKNLFGVL
jgi:ornithine cyclodeaminase